MRTLLTALLFLALTLPLAAMAEPSSIVVVRHAEKADDGTRDPALTAAGRARAEALADALQHADVTGLIASQYKRTRQTLAVLGERQGLEVTVVPAESGGIRAHISSIARAVSEWSSGGVLVIAGHSNTVPLIVEALSGEPVSPIDEAEYDRLFVLLPGNPSMKVISARYGTASEPSAH
ncbi:SixA phosphatase family protein [Wenzhouxiangella sp. EGI_FJ10305]|uniref:SixA phosphatase family protein n=1 Tax=Wenzhouxiangella sp. EGI_FJ10305 TaxID=3243768 RepID=UPI0035D805C9